MPSFADTLSSCLTANPPDLERASKTLVMMSKSESTQAISNIIAANSGVIQNIIERLSVYSDETVLSSAMTAMACPEVESTGADTWKCWAQILASRQLLPLDGPLGNSLLNAIKRPDVDSSKRDWLLALYMDASGQSRTALETVLLQLRDLTSYRSLDATWGRCWHHPERTPAIRDRLMTTGSRPDANDKTQSVVTDGPHWGDPEDIELIWTRLSAPNSHASLTTLRHWLVNREPPSAQWSPAFRAAILVMTRRTGDMGHPFPGTIPASTIHQVLTPPARAYLKACIASPGFVDDVVLSHLSCSPDPKIRTWAMLELVQISVDAKPQAPEMPTDIENRFSGKEMPAKARS